MSLKKLKNRLKAEGVKFDVLCAMPEGTTLRVGKDLDGVLMWLQSTASMHRRRLHLRFHVLVDHLGAGLNVFTGEFIGHTFQHAVDDGRLHLGLR